QTKSGGKGVLSYNAHWQDINKNVLLNEQTTFVFSGGGQTRIIDRITTLTAIQKVVFTDAKDGMMGLRVAHELQLPDTSVKKFTDDKGNVTAVQGNAAATGNYITSVGKTGNDAWGTRAAWCMLYGREGADSISIAIIDHPKNVGYPAYWHARDYGLFAVNPLGQKIFSNGKETLNFTLEKGNSVTFRYRIVIHSGADRLSNSEVDKLAKAFDNMQ
ncbi:MAG TPA: PmoA family protein, partial [Chitinophagaceae bacterium]|nr:PmoA family protein [Chitinophagaceae bacterium]